MKQLYELSRPFPEKFVHKAPAGKFGDYIQHSVIRQRLLSVVGPYSQEVKTITREVLTDKQGNQKEVITGVVLALTVEIERCYIRCSKKMCYGIRCRLTLMGTVWRQVRILLR